MGWRSATTWWRRHREARLVTLICKSAAIKGDTPLSISEMQELVRRLEGCRSPRTCPHGRPTMIYLSSGESGAAVRTRVTTFRHSSTIRRVLAPAASFLSEE